MRSNDTCPRWGVCGGCPWGGRPLEDQRRDKRLALGEFAERAHFVATPPFGLRDRADLMWQRTESGVRLGLYHLDRREVVDLDRCPMMSPALEAFFIEYRRRTPPAVSRGSVRLRVAPNGARGVWLDFANQDVKALFDEREYLAWLSELAFVEIGQRRKRLIWREGLPKLVDPEPRPWFETYDAGGVGIPLFGPVGGFSQGGFVGNRALVAEVGRSAEIAGVTDWLELFGGNGNFALSLASRGHAVELIEVDQLALGGLARSLERRPDLRVRASKVDAYLTLDRLPSVAGRGVLVDPPRAGLRQTLAWLARERPPALIYVSCFTEVFVADARRLVAGGYRLERLVGVDQFAQSPHAEWVALFKF